MDAEYVIKVWFSGADKFCPDGDIGQILNEPLWMPKGKPLARWSIDGLITCADTCWVYFGPYSNKESARSAARRIELYSGGIEGFLLKPIQCVSKAEHKYHIYTDG